MERQKNEGLPEYVDRTYIGVPQSVAAAYKNQCRGNLMAYYIDEDPTVRNPVYKKLKEIYKKVWDFNVFHEESDKNLAARMAWRYMEMMGQRRMTEEMYRRIENSSLEDLETEFCIDFRLDESIRAEIEEMRKRDWEYIEKYSERHNAFRAVVWRTQLKRQGQRMIRAAKRMKRK